MYLENVRVIIARQKFNKLKPFSGIAWEKIKSVIRLIMSSIQHQLDPKNAYFCS